MKKVYVCMVGFCEDNEWPGAVCKTKKKAVEFMRLNNFSYCKDQDMWYLPDEKVDGISLLGGRIRDCEMIE
jgi:hypothetical protein